MLPDFHLRWSNGVSYSVDFRASRTDRQAFEHALSTAYHRFREQRPRDLVHLQVRYGRRAHQWGLPAELFTVEIDGGPSSGASYIYVYNRPGKPLHPAGCTPSGTVEAGVGPADWQTTWLMGACENMLRWQSALTEMVSDTIVNLDPPTEDIAND